MPLVIVITGMPGAGKGTAVENWARSNNARRVEVDNVITEGGWMIPASEQEAAGSNAA